MSRPAAVAATVAAAFACASAAVAPAQQDPKKLDFGAAYSFAEREPRTVLETTIDRLLPSIVKVHGASGLATITSYATGIVVSEQGHILTLDQVLVQRDRTRVVRQEVGDAAQQIQILPAGAQVVPLVDEPLRERRQVGVAERIGILGEERRHGREGDRQGDAGRGARSEHAMSHRSLLGTERRR